VLRFAGGTDADLRIQWQEFLLMMIANAFELPPMLLGLQADVNRSTAGEMADEAFQSAVVPVAKLLAEHITRDLFAKKLGWREFEFSFNDLETRNEMEEVQIQTELLKAGVLTVDEVREMRGLPSWGRRWPFETHHRQSRWRRSDRLQRRDLSGHAAHHRASAEHAVALHRPSGGWHAGEPQLGDRLARTRPAWTSRCLGRQRDRTVHRISRD
jgi:hypothetical protein